MSPQAKHIHKIKLHKYKSGNSTYFCVEDCNYKVTPALALGKTVICWRCNEPFKMTEYSLRLVKPHCENCHKGKVNKNSKTPAISTFDSINFVPEPSEVEVPLLTEHFQTLGSLSDRLKQATEKEDDDEEEEL